MVAKKAVCMDGITTFAVSSTQNFGLGIGTKLVVLLHGAASLSHN